MSYPVRPDIYKMLDTLTLEMKEELLEYLKTDIASIKAAPPKTYLEKQWAEIKRLIEDLKYEPYIDDQIQIEAIWDICEELIKSGMLKQESWETRRMVLQDIIDAEYFDYYGVIDPMEDLFDALMLSKEEKLEVADIIFETCSDFMKEDAAKLYKENGRQKEYIDFQEQMLKDKQAPYIEVIDYYRDLNPEKAVEIAELGLRKCKDDKTRLMIFLIQKARESGDDQRFKKLLKSAKKRQAVNYTLVMQALDQ